VLSIGPESLANPMTGAHACAYWAVRSAEAYLKKTAELIRARATAEDAQVFRLDAR